MWSNDGGADGVPLVAEQGEDAREGGFPLARLVSGWGIRARRARVERKNPV